MVRGRAGRWHDLVIGDACIDGDVFSADPAPAVFASDYVPLWAGLAAPGSAQAAAVVASLRRSGARATPVRTTHGPRTTCLVRTIISLSVLQGASAASFYQRCLEEACPCLMSSLGLDLTGTAPSLRHPMQGCAYAAFADVAAWRLGLLRRGGVMASLQETGQQRDAPNAWPPLQALLAEGLATYGGAPLLVMSAACCILWLCVALLVAQRMSCMQSGTGMIEVHVQAGMCTCMQVHVLYRGKDVM